MNYRNWLLLSLIPLTFCGIAIYKVLEFKRAMDWSSEGPHYAQIEGCTIEVSQSVQEQMYPFNPKEGHYNLRLHVRSLRHSELEEPLELLEQCTSTYDVQYFRFQAESDSDRLVSLGTYLLNESGSSESPSIAPPLRGEFGMRTLVADTYYHLAQTSDDKMDHYYHKAEQLYLLELDECNDCDYAIVALVNSLVAQRKFEAARTAVADELENNSEGYRAKVLEELLRNIKWYENDWGTGGYLEDNIIL